MISRAFISEDKKYRYSLTRIWDKNLDIVLFIGLNPSTADEKVNDPTIRRLIGYARRWGYGGMFVCNLFAFRTPYPNELFKAKHPIGPENDGHIVELMKRSRKTVLVYGNHGNKLNRHSELLKIIHEPFCIKISKSKMPMHPLYLKYTDRPIKYFGKQHDT